MGVITRVDRKRLLNTSLELVALDSTSGDEAAMGEELDRRGADGVIRTDGSTILGPDDKSGIAGCLELITDECRRRVESRGP